MDNFIVEFADGHELVVPAETQEDAAIQAEQWIWQTGQDLGSIVSVRLA